MKKEKKHGIVKITLLLQNLMQICSICTKFSIFVAYYKLFTSYVESFREC